MTAAWSLFEYIFILFWFSRADAADMLKVLHQCKFHLKTANIHSVSTRAVLKHQFNYFAFAISTEKHRSIIGKISTNRFSARFQYELWSVWWKLRMKCAHQQAHTHQNVCRIVMRDRSRVNMSWKCDESARERASAYEISNFRAQHHQRALELIEVDSKVRFTFCCWASFTLFNLRWCFSIR